VIRRGGSHALSLALHGALLAWVALPPAVRQAPRGQSLYEREIAPHRDRIVWYTFREKLPQVSPLERRGPSQPPRARVKAPQPVVAQPPRALPLPQLIWRPAPEIELPREIRSPNLVAVAAPPRPKAFTPPREQARPRPARPVLADAPRLEASPMGTVPFTDPARRPPPRAFRAPQAQAVARSAPLLPEPGIPISGGAPRAGFRAPVHVPAPAAVINEQPEVGGGTGGSLSVAVIGLNPAARLEVPLPEGSRPARISAGPEPGKGEGGAEPVESARIFVPDLMIRNGPREAVPSLARRPVSVTSTENLRAALRSAPRLADVAAATRVSSAPLPHFEGRTIYSMSVQMPNITSYSGSWLIWLAERGPGSAGLRPPVPLRKVDPKYAAAAVEERVEGIVRLAAVIRRDGHVDTVTVVQHLDERLDRSAVEALAKWQFEPASRAGTPVEVDAVVEIPFRLRPRETR